MPRCTLAVKLIDENTQHNTESSTDISLMGRKTYVLTFLAAHNQNINKLDLLRVFWTSKDKAFYDARLQLTDCRHDQA